MTQLLHVQGDLFELFDAEPEPCQRWRRRAGSWRRPEEGGFNPDRYGVTELDYQPAQRFITEHHYSGRFSSAVLRYGLVDLVADQLVGALVLGNGMAPAVMRNPFPHLEPHGEALELSRLVLLDEVPANAESWFVARALGHAGGEHGLRGVVMYSDPNERVTPAGLTMPGHLGIVYQALGCRYVGTSKPRYEDHLPDGTVLPERSASKVVGLEQGAYGTVRRLVQLGAADPGDLARLTEDQRAAWLAGALAAIGARRHRRDGKHRYLLCTGDRAQRRETAKGIPLPAKEYPKRRDHVLAA